MVFLIILFSIVILGCAALLLWEKNRSKKENQQNGSGFNERIANIEEFYQIDNIREGIIYKEDQCYMMARIGGLNFTVMSLNEQHNREDALISIFTRLDYPVRFITNTVIVDTSEEAMRIAEKADQTPEGTLQRYRYQYAGALELMRAERAVTTQSTFLIIPGKDKEELRNRYRILAAALKDQGRMTVETITTTEEVTDIIQEVLMPDSIFRPSQKFQFNVDANIHLSEKEVLEYVQ